MANTISVNVVADVRRLRQGVDDVNRRMGRLGGAARRMGGLLAGAFVGGAALQFGKDVVRAASDAQQSIGATETVYGKYADTVIAKSKTAARAVGLSANDYRELSNTLGSMLANTGTPMDQLAGKTGRLVKLGADLAATFGGTTSDAVAAIGSLMRGEADPIEQFGVSIKQSDVNARLAAKGLDGLTGKQLKNAQATARLELLYKQTRKAQGQFARESNTFAGQQQRLAATWENLKATLGKALLPVLTRVAGYLADNLPGAFAAVKRQAQELAPTARAIAGAFRAMAPAVKAVGGFLLDHKNTIAAVIAAYAGFRTINATMNAYRATLAGIKGLQQTYALATYGAAGAQTTLAGRLAAAAGAFRVKSAAMLASGRASATALAVNARWQVMLARQKAAMIASAIATRASAAATKAYAIAQRILNAAMKANPVILIVTTLVALGVALVAAYKKSEKFRAIVDGAFSAVRKVAAKVFGWLRGAVTGVIGFVRDHWRAVAKILTAPWRAGLAVLRTILSAIRKAVSAGVRAAVSVITTVWGKIRGIASRIWSGVRDVTARVWDAITSVIGRQLDAARNIVSRVTDAIGRALSAAWSAAQRAASAAWQGIVGAVRDAIGNLISAVGNIKDAVSGVFSGAASWLWDAGKAIIQGLLDGIQSMIGAVQSKLSELTGLIPDWKGPRRRDRVLLVPAGVAIMRGLVAGIDKGWSSVKDRLGKVTDKIEKSFDRAEKRTTRNTVRRTRERLRWRNQDIRDRARRLARNAANRADPGDKRDAYRKRYEKATRRLIDIDKRLDKVRDRIAKRFDRRKKRALRSLKDERKSVRQSSKAYDRMAARVERAQDKLKDATKRRNDYMRQIRDAAIEFGNITNLGELESGEVTPRQIVTDMRNRANATRNYYDMLRKLKRLGLNDTALQQLYEAGVEGGTPQAAALLEGGQSVIGRVNEAQRELRKAAKRLGKFASRDMYQAGVNAAQGLVRGLKKSMRVLRKEARRMARVLVRAIKRHLKIHSPSKVFRDEVGANIVAGLKEGLRPQVIAATGRDMSQQLVDGFGRPALSSDALAGAGGNTYTISVTVQPGAAPADVGRQIVSAIRSYERVGGAAWRS